ncbi:superoxide dismutase [Sphingoaurantiacus capsulatus]|uniref:Superoxide dismutase n=1 Tax=Sphingoaurantiacus capsulatus TaxID=1771310 RepID=A0ABV7X5S2_9SPHN
MAITLPPLPFAYDALEPHMSKRTLEFHHDKHHKAYVDKTNELIAGTELADADLETIVKKAKADGDEKLFNQSGQVWNHNFLWQSLRPEGGAGPSGDLAEMIEDAFDGADGFAKTFKEEAVGHFASGWAWLVLGADKLEVISTHDADTALVHDGKVPLIVLDVWEHAYYLDYQHKRPDFVDTFLSKLINWDFAAENLAAAREKQRKAA